MFGLGSPPPLNALAQSAPPLPQQVVVHGRYGGPWIFHVVPFISLKWLDGAAVYIIARTQFDSSFGLLRPFGTGVSAPNYFLHFGYVGQCESLRDRHCRHHRAHKFDEFGANIALLHGAGDEALRRLIELDIRHRYDPPINRE